jgi:prepilin-type N-terminal cleavage/methylation domain-containing protein
MSALRDRLRQDESGFTLIELLVATVIGMVIMLAAFGLADSSVRAFGKADNRSDVTQRGRLGLDVIARTLRSQICPVGATSTSTNTIGSFVTATDTKAVFWADLGRASSGTRPADPSLDGFSYANGTISELSYAGNVTTGTETAVPVVTSVVPSNGSSTVLFQYWRFNPSYTGSNAFYQQMTQPIADADLSDIVRVTTSFKAYPRKGTASDKVSQIFSDQATLRTADFGRQETPSC